MISNWKKTLFLLSLLTFSCNSISNYRDIESELHENAALELEGLLAFPIDSDYNYYIDFEYYNFGIIKNPFTGNFTFNDSLTIFLLFLKW